MSTSLPAAVLALRPLALCVAIVAACAAAPLASANLSPDGGGGQSAYVRSTESVGSAPQARAPASTIVVTSCADDGSPGTLRFAVETAALSGDTVDISQLSCSTITLQSGAIIVAQDTLTINGPGSNQLAISANLEDRVFTHNGTGALTLRNLSVLEGKIDTNDFAVGGCIYSSGVVNLVNAQVKYCQANGGLFANGGAIYARGSVGLDHSTVGVATANGGTFGADGGAINTRDFTAKYSEVGSSTATTTGAYLSYGGGVWASGNVVISDSTIGNNTADAVGGIMIAGGAANARAVIVNSTVSDNTAGNSKIGSGVYVGYSTLIANSTISGNVEENSVNAKYGGGVFVAGTAALELESTALGGNEFVQAGVSGYLPSDLGSSVAGITVTGDNNLINIVTNGVVVPPDTLRTTPNLGPLQNNGGGTSTQIPNADSPLIGGGNTASNPGACDQRGPGFPRTTDGRIDIGAVQAPTGADTIFADGFENTSSCAD